MDNNLNLLRDKKMLQNIPYKINSYSSFASSYYPTNILVNNPADANSRWSTTTNDHRQYIILKYDSSIVSTIQFGKFSKIHVCNIKEMKISVSYDKINWTEVFYGGLKNDTRAETHNLQYYLQDSTNISCKNNLLISRYMKIEPLAAWGMNFNYSIWYIKLKGITNKNMDKIVEDRQREKEVNLLRKLLKKYPDVQPSTSIVERYLNKGKYEDLEEYIKKLHPETFDKYINKSPYKGIWKEISEEKSEDKSWPCARGGHQMVSLDKGIFMYGGWNGSEELGDTWIYDGKWINNRSDIDKNFTKTCESEDLSISEELQDEKNFRDVNENFRDINENFREAIFSTNINSETDINSETNINSDTNLNSDTKKREILDMGLTHHK